MKSKLKAFTLTELIVVMIISTIVISLSYMAFSMVRKQVNNIQNRLTLKEELLSLEKVLNRDLNTFGIADYKNQILKLKNPLDSIFYKIDNKQVLRNKDTFKVVVNEFTVFLNGQKVKSGKIDALRFSSENINNREVFIYTIKDAASYLNN
ncbi:hypothetical protein BTO06_01285 [Tenacibaculum sp. SZ-18]|uniref:PulJ/GspJ family protein n=1 Tax=Tenacibaculum sp. SZ-18 TaxID=754423 RepID=UPI000C2CFC3E|nr:prepilin-type N-terminal cleavage/methylation domain-containing protein [Tenacibaculum sp. SZ-18]AUC13867.1 hypothetical protein BTO06_01285 [Tenacibaculum sp. SZ-18]